MTDLGLHGYREIINYPELMEEFQVADAVFKYLSEIGYTTVKQEDYKRMVNEIKETRVKLKSEK
jgi:hypothetical protein